MVVNVVGDGETLLGGRRLGKGTGMVGRYASRGLLCLEQVRTFSKAASFLPALLICSSAMSLI